MLINASSEHVKNRAVVWGTGSDTHWNNVTDWGSNISGILVRGETLTANNGNMSVEGHSDTHFTNSLDTILFLLFVAVWLTSVICFYLRWNNVRMMSPVGGHARFRYNPRNLDTITVVKTTDESVIYRK